MENFLISPESWHSRIKMFKTIFMEKPRMGPSLWLACVLPSFPPFIPLQVHSYPLFQRVLSAVIYSYSYVSSSASVFFFPVPPDFSFEQGCSPGVLLDFSQSTGLEHWVGLSTGNIRTKTEVEERAVSKPPRPPPPAPLLPQGGSAVTGRKDC